MSIRVRIILPAPFIFAALLPAFLHGDDTKCEVNVNAYVTPEGKNVPAPAPGHPVYYVPVVLGYREKGPAVAGEKPPERRTITQQLAKVLADQGYFAVAADSPAPKLVLLIGWGAMHPDTDIALDDASDPDATVSPSVTRNRNESLAIVAGHTFNNLDLNFEKESIMQATESDRYYVVVEAYDFEAAKVHKKKLLWRTNMSVDSGGISFDDVAKGLIASAGPMFGHETLRPKWAQVPIRQGKAELGPMQVIEYLDAPSNPQPARPEKQKPAQKTEAPEKKP